jgi:sec-independent protein translocase protein TatA
MDGITPAHLILVLVIALLVLGPGKLPEAGAALGKSLREFRDAMSGTERTPPPPTPPASLPPPPASLPPPPASPPPASNG